MNAAEFIEIAAQWTARGGRPAELRSAISRAYYGAYHLATSFLREHFGWACRGGNEHQWVQRHFLAAKIPAAVTVGKTLVNLRENRTQADYELDDVRAEQHSNAKLCVERAEDVRKLLGSLQPNEIREIQVAMQQYRDQMRLI